jgi:bifunctional UDP-N-acetylglucosamine pyrophosphorylase/glucosamine-1-phosphate N-acetyltransferase
MLQYVLDALSQAGFSDIILILGHGREEILRRIGTGCRIAVQAEQLGTGHALMQAESLIGPKTTILVVSGDTPLLPASVLAEITAEHEAAKRAATVMSATAEVPAGYGRILRDASGVFSRVVEQKEATAEQAAIREVNAGVYCFDSDTVFSALKELRSDNAQGEYYLPEVCSILQREGLQVGVYHTSDFLSVQGVNDRVQLAEAAAVLRSRALRKWMQAGVTIVDPATVYIDSDVVIGADTIIYPMTFLEGHTTIGSDCVIGPGARIRDACIGDHNQVQQAVIAEAVTDAHCVIGPFAHLRPQVTLAEGVKIGTFVEVKQSQVGAGSKIPHLSYVGDAALGTEVNIGAGAITCNYDGRRKYRTVIGDGAFIGSNSNLIAPITIGPGAMTGAGSSLSGEVEAHMLAVERGLLKIAPAAREVERKQGGEQGE